MLQTLLEERFKLTLHREKKDLPMYALVVGKNGPKLKESADDPVAKDASAPAVGGAPPPPPPPADGHSGEAAMGRIKVGSDGFPKLPAGAPRGAIMIMMTNGRFRLQTNKQSMAGLADMLSGQLDRPVVDLTGLKGNYDITLDYAPEEGSGIGMRIAMLGAAAPLSHAGGGEGALPVASTPDGQSGPSIFAALQEQLGLKLEAKKGPVDLLVIDHVEKVPTEN
jgi:uncharacterized protein (TIGR03435 family)